MYHFFFDFLLGLLNFRTVTVTKKYSFPGIPEKCIHIKALLHLQRSKFIGLDVQTHIQVFSGILNSFLLDQVSSIYLLVHHIL